MGRKRKKREVLNEEAGVELNVMPFIDIFSLLCTFLLFSAVFVSMGILEVQIPFLTNAADPSNEDSKPKRALILRADVSRKTIELKSSYSLPPKDSKKEQFPNNEQGIADLNSRLKSLKDEHEEADKLTLYVEDDIIYDNLIKIVDAIKLRNLSSGGTQQQGDPGDEAKEEMLFPKVIMGSVAL